MGFEGYIELDGTFAGFILSRNSGGTPANADSLPTFSVISPTQTLLSTGTASFLKTGTVTGATNASPIVVTSSAHNLTTGARVTITGVGGNTAANGTFTVTYVDANSFSLLGSTGNGAYTSGGTWNQTGLYKYSVAATAAAGYAAGLSYTVIGSWAVSSANIQATDTFIVT